MADENITTNVEETAAEQPAEKTYTQADVDKMVQDRLARAQRKHDAELKTAREQARTEAERLAKMTEDERYKAQREEAEAAAAARENALNQREKDLTMRELKSTAIESLRAKGLDTDLASLLDYSDADACAKSIDIFEKAMAKAVQKSVDERLSRSHTTPITRSGGAATSLADQVRAAMGLTDKKE